MTDRRVALSVIEVLATVGRRVRSGAGGHDRPPGQIAGFFHNELGDLRTVWIDEIVKVDAAAGEWITTHRMTLINLDTSEVLTLEWAGAGRSFAAAIESARSSFAQAQTGMNRKADA